MSIELQTGTTLPFERFWKWLADHPNCLLRAGTGEAVLYDQEDFHWHFDEDGPTAQVVQLIRGKQLIGELLLDTRDVLYVQAGADPESAERGWVLFQVIGGPKEGPYPVYHFLLAHGLEGEAAHLGALKH
ncbi:MAG: hypothetical protein ACOZIN_05545 [Myxococcota bacterium]